jgi:hypothetical protein
MALRRPRARTPQEAALRKLHQATRERPFQQWVIEVCQRMGHLVFHDPDARRCAHCGQLFHDRRVRGFPDLVIVCRPRRGWRGPWLLFVELKTERGQLRDEQKVWGSYLSAIVKLVPGVYYGVWRPSDMTLIVRLLTGEDAEGNTDADAA